MALEAGSAASEEEEREEEEEEAEEEATVTEAVRWMTLRVTSASALPRGGTRVQRRRGRRACIRPQRQREGGVARGAGAGRQGLTLVHFSAQPEPFLTQNTP
jgi:hypothetical protein